MKEVLSIAKDMFKETDWKDVGQARVDDCKAFAKRCKKEYGYLKEMSPKERWDVVVNGEKYLGVMYRTGQMAFTRREWRGVKDTAYTSGPECGACCSPVSEKIWFPPWQASSTTAGWFPISAATPSWTRTPWACAAKR